MVRLAAVCEPFCLAGSGFCRSVRRLDPLAVAAREGQRGGENQGRGRGVDDSITLVCLPLFSLALNVVDNALDFTYDLTQVQWFVKYFLDTKSAPHGI